MILQNSVKRIISEVGKQFGLSVEESQEHYIQYIEEFILKSMYDADFDVLRIEGLGVITPGLTRTRGYLKSFMQKGKVTPEIQEKLERHISHVEDLNASLKHKKLFG